jgi:hypothetical protein
MTWKCLKASKTMKEFQKVLRYQTTKPKLTTLIKLFQWNNTIVVKMLQCMITHLEYILNLSRKEFKAVKTTSINFTQIKSCLLIEMQKTNTIAMKIMSFPDFKDTMSTKSSRTIMILPKVCTTASKMQRLLLCLQEFQTATARTCRVLK